MKQPVTVRVADLHAGEVTATIQPDRDHVAIALSGASCNCNLALSRKDAANLARAILDATGDEQSRPTLPQSRQIGGIIGPY